MRDGTRPGTCMSECVSEMIINIVIHRNLLQLFVTIDNANRIFIALK